MTWRFLKKLRTELPYNPAISPEENENTIQFKKIMHLVQSRIIYSSQNMKTI